MEKYFFLLVSILITQNAYSLPLTSITTYAAPLASTAGRRLMHTAPHFFALCKQKINHKLAIPERPTFEELPLHMQEFVHDFGLQPGDYKSFDYEMRKYAFEKFQATHIANTLEKKGELGLAWDAFLLKDLRKTWRDMYYLIVYLQQPTTKATFQA